MKYKLTLVAIAAFVSACERVGNMDPILDNSTQDIISLACVEETIGASCTRNDGESGVCIARGTCAIKCESIDDCPYAGQCRSSMCLNGACWFHPLIDGASCGTDENPGQCRLGTCE